MGPDAASPVPSHSPDPAAEKVRVARISALAAAGLMVAKGLVGWSTGSLAILSEAAHSALDLVATLITLVAVRVADRPPDQDHHYGHGKAENLAALAETVLLLLTCGWIVVEAVERLFHKPVQVQATWVAFGVVIASILVDVSRSRALSRVAEATGSQALEADALHFRTEVWSSLTVLVGLGAVRAGQTWEIPWLALADPLAGLGVAMVVVVVGARLGKRAVDVLLDRAPQDAVERIRAAIRGVRGVEGRVALRVRTSGGRLFVDAAVPVERGATFEGAHAVVQELEERIRALAPEASVVIHAEPVQARHEGLGEAIRRLVSRHAVGVHDILLLESDGSRSVELHLEVPATTPLVAAHALTERIQAEVGQELPQLDSIQIHVDPVRPERPPRVRPTGEAARVVERVREMGGRVPGIRDCHKISVKRVRDRLWVFCHCRMDPGLSLLEAHELGLELGRQVRRELPEVERFTVHAEPTSDHGPGTTDDRPWTMDRGKPTPDP